MTKDAARKQFSDSYSATVGAYWKFHVYCMFMCITVHYIAVTVTVLYFMGYRYMKYYIHSACSVHVWYKRYFITCGCSWQHHHDDDEDDNVGFRNAAVPAGTWRCRHSRLSLTATTTETVECSAPARQSRTGTRTFCREPWREKQNDSDC